MSSSLEQMNASITQNAENSRQVEQAAAKGALSAEESGNAVKETVEAMKQIAAKTSVIEEIAYRPTFSRSTRPLSGTRRRPGPWLCSGCS